MNNSDEIKAFSDSLASSKVRIFKAFSDLLEKKSYKKITIMDICQEASISKATFYRAFDGKPDIVQWLFDRACAEGVDLTGISYNFFEGTVITMRILESQRSLLRKVLKSESSYYSNITISQRRDALYNTIENIKGIDIDLELSFQIEAYLSMEVVLPRTFLSMDDESAPTVKQFSNLFASMVPRRLYDIINEPSDADLTARSRCTQL